MLFAMDPGCGMRMPRLDHDLARGAARNLDDSVAKKEQGRRRSMPSTTLPAPDIEIGSRHPV
jgi:hypothetical protein